MPSLKQAPRPPTAAVGIVSKPAIESAASPAARAPHTVATLRSRAEILAIVHRECGRCERSGLNFCLVIFEAGRTRRALDRLSELLIHNARATDEVGRFDNHRLCVVLAYTDVEGADYYLARVNKRARHEHLNVSSRLLVYPSPQFAEQLRREDSRNDDDSSDNGNSAGGSGGEVVRAIERVDDLLVRPMPWWKRLIDIIVSCVGLVVASPAMALAAMAIKLSSRGPIFFLQQRAGLGGRPFTIYKFRTMVPNAEKLKASLLDQSEQDGPAFKMTHDPRVTRVGRLLRKTSIDELPQLWNVLKGEMSLVGPRPLPVDEARAVDAWHRRRLDVTPGVTCIWQVEGRGTVSFDDWVRMDRRYIRRRSVTHDVLLLMRTLPAVLMRRGAK